MLAKLGLNAHKINSIIHATISPYQLFAEQIIDKYAFFRMNYLGMVGLTYRKPPSQSGESFTENVTVNNMIVHLEQDLHQTLSYDTKYLSNQFALNHLQKIVSQFQHLDNNIVYPPIEQKGNQEAFVDLGDRQSIYQMDQQISVVDNSEFIVETRIKQMQGRMNHTQRWIERVLRHHVVMQTDGRQSSIANKAIEHSQAMYFTHTRSAKSLLDKVSADQLFAEGYIELSPLDRQITQYKHTALSFIFRDKIIRSESNGVTDNLVLNQLMTKEVIHNMTHVVTNEGNRQALADKSGDDLKSINRTMDVDRQQTDSIRRLDSLPTTYINEAYQWVKWHHDVQHVLIPNDYESAPLNGWHVKDIRVLTREERKDRQYSRIKSIRSQESEIDRAQSEENTVYQLDETDSMAQERSLIVTPRLLQTRLVDQVSLRTEVSESIHEKIVDKARMEQTQERMNRSQRWVERVLVNHFLPQVDEQHISIANRAVEQTQAMYRTYTERSTMAFLDRLLVAPSMKESDFDPSDTDADSVERQVSRYKHTALSLILHDEAARIGRSEGSENRAMNHMGMKDVIRHMNHFVTNEGNRQTSAEMSGNLINTRKKDDVNLQKADPNQLLHLPSTAYNNQVAQWMEWHHSVQHLFALNSVRSARLDAWHVNDIRVLSREERIDHQFSANKSIRLEEKADDVAPPIDRIVNQFDEMTSLETETTSSQDDELSIFEPLSLAEMSESRPTTLLQGHHGVVRMQRVRERMEHTQRWIERVLMHYRIPQDDRQTSIANNALEHTQVMYRTYTERTTSLLGKMNLVQLSEDQNQDQRSLKHPLLRYSHTALSLILPNETIRDGSIEAIENRVLSRIRTKDVIRNINQYDTSEENRQVLLDNSTSRTKIIDTFHPNKSDTITQLPLLPTFYMNDAVKWVEWHYDVQKVLTSNRNRYTRVDRWHVKDIRVLTRKKNLIDRESFINWRIRTEKSEDGLAPLKERHTNQWDVSTFVEMKTSLLDAANQDGDKRSADVQMTGLRPVTLFWGTHQSEDYENSYDVVRMQQVHDRMNHTQRWVERILMHQTVRQDDRQTSIAEKALEHTQAMYRTHKERSLSSSLNNKIFSTFMDESPVESSMDKRSLEQKIPRYRHLALSLILPDKRARIETNEVLENRVLNRIESKDVILNRYNDVIRDVRTEVFAELNSEVKYSETNQPRNRQKSTQMQQWYSFFTSNKDSVSTWFQWHHDVQLVLALSDNRTKNKIGEWNVKDFRVMTREETNMDHRPLANQNDKLDVLDPSSLDDGREIRLEAISRKRENLLLRDRINHTQHWLERVLIRHLAPRGIGLPPIVNTVLKHQQAMYQADTERMTSPLDQMYLAPQSMEEMNIDQHISRYKHTALTWTMANEIDTNGTTEITENNLLNRLAFNHVLRDSHYLGREEDKSIYQKKSSPIQQFYTAKTTYMNDTDAKQLLKWHDDAQQVLAPNQHKNEPLGHWNVKDIRMITREESRLAHVILTTNRIVYPQKQTNDLIGKGEPRAQSKKSRGINVEDFFKGKNFSSVSAFRLSLPTLVNRTNEHFMVSKERKRLEQLVEHVGDGLKGQMLDTESIADEPSLSNRSLPELENETLPVKDFREVPMKQMRERMIHTQHWVERVLMQHKRAKVSPSPPSSIDRLVTDHRINERNIFNESEFNVAVNRENVDHFPFHSHSIQHIEETKEVMKWQSDMKNLLDNSSHHFYNDGVSSNLVTETLPVKDFREVPMKQMRERMIHTQRWVERVLMHDHKREKTPQSSIDRLVTNHHEDERNIFQQSEFNVAVNREKVDQLPLHSHTIQHIEETKQVMNWQSNMKNLLDTSSHHFYDGGVSSNLVTMQLNHRQGVAEDIVLKHFAQGNPIKQLLENRSVMPHRNIQQGSFQIEIQKIAEKIRRSMLLKDLLITGVQNKKRIGAQKDLLIVAQNQDILNNYTMPELADREYSPLLTEDVSMEFAQPRMPFDDFPTQSHEKVEQENQSDLIEDKTESQKLTFNDPSKLSEQDLEEFVDKIYKEIEKKFRFEQQTRGFS